MIGNNVAELNTGAAQLASTIHAAITYKLGLSRAQKRKGRKNPNVYKRQSICQDFSKETEVVSPDIEAKSINDNLQSIKVEPSDDVGVSSSAFWSQTASEEPPEDSSYNQMFLRRDFEAVSDDSIPDSNEKFDSLKNSEESTVYRNMLAVGVDNNSVNYSSDDALLDETKENGWISSEEGESRILRQLLESRSIYEQTAAIGLSDSNSPDHTVGSCLSFWCALSYLEICIKKA